MYDEAVPETAVDPKDIITDWKAPDAGVDSAVAIPVGNETYYMAISMPNATYPYAGHGMDFTVTDLDAFLNLE